MHDYIASQIRVLTADEVSDQGKMSPEELKEQLRDVSGKPQVL